MRRVLRVADAEPPSTDLKQAGDDAPHQRESQDARAHRQRQGGQELRRGRRVRQEARGGARVHRAAGHGPRVEGGHRAVPRSIHRLRSVACVACVRMKLCACELGTG